MTLILSALTQNEVVQVSDRRFTFIRPDGSVRSRNDERNKAVLFCGRVMFGFTGRGDLGIKRSGPMADTQTFLYVPPDGNTTIQLGPVLTCGQGIMSGFRAAPINEDLDKAAPSIARPQDRTGLIRRWYLVPIVGSGTPDDPYRANTLNHSASAHIPTDKDGRPLNEFALAVVSAAAHRDLEKHPLVLPLADLTDLDTAVVDLDPHKRTWLKHAAAVRAVSSEGSAREVVRRIGQQLEPGFDEQRFWVS